MLFLFLLFLILKLSNIITWSWQWVLIPVWGPIALIIFIAICVAALASKYHYNQRVNLKKK